MRTFKEVYIARLELFEAEFCALSRGTKATLSFQRWCKRLCEVVRFVTSATKSLAAKQNKLWLVRRLFQEIEADWRPVLFFLLQFNVLMFSSQASDLLGEIKAPHTADLDSLALLQWQISRVGRRSTERKKLQKALRANWQGIQERFGTQAEEERWAELKSLNKIYLLS